jgi:peptide-methionine (R)-S-oxide reductase
MNRRSFIKTSLLGMGLLAFGTMATATKLWAADIITKITKTNEQWRASLTPEQYNVLREEGTEHPFTSPLNDEHREGIFACVGCNLPLLTSDKKFDSGTGWPSFFDSIPSHIETKTDIALLYPRTEYHCARCGGHHGHVFNDGPQPTGLRYCNNGVALTFIPKES